MTKLFVDANASCKVGNEMDICPDGKNISLVKELGSSNKYTKGEQDIIYSTNNFHQQVKLLLFLVERMKSLAERSQTNKTDEQIVFARLSAEAKTLVEKIETQIITTSSKRFKTKKKLQYIESLFTLKNDIYKIIEFLNKNIVNDSMNTIMKTRSILELSSKMIQKQGNAIALFHGTCGLCSIANATNNIGAKLTEKKLVKVAVSHNWCTYDSDPSENGGTSGDDRKSILQYLGYNCESIKNQSLEEIYNNLKNGKEAIISIHSDVLETHLSCKQKQPTRTNHVVTIIDVEIDENGKPIGLWIHDTGIHSDMGNLFFCNANDYEFWKSTPNSFVQYISK